MCSATQWVRRSYATGPSALIASAPPLWGFRMRHGFGRQPVRDHTAPSVRMHLIYPSIVNAVRDLTVGLNPCLSFRVQPVINGPGKQRPGSPPPAHAGRPPSPPRKQGPAARGSELLGQSVVVGLHRTSQRVHPAIPSATSPSGPQTARANGNLPRTHPPPRILGFKACDPLGPSRGGQEFRRTAARPRHIARP